MQNNNIDKKDKTLRDKAGGFVEKVGQKISDAGAPSIGQKVHDLGDKLEKHHTKIDHPEDV